MNTILNYVDSGRINLEKFAMMEDKPNVISWAHLNFKDMMLFDFGLSVKENDDLLLRTGLIFTKRRIGKLTGSIIQL